MSEIEKIENRIQSLSAEELAKFRAWFIEFDGRVWDQQIEADVKAGKLKNLAAEALSEYKAGKTRKL
jgi:hypothetical protein